MRKKNTNDVVCLILNRNSFLVDAYFFDKLNVTNCDCDIQKNCVIMINIIMFENFFTVVACVYIKQLKPTLPNHSGLYIHV